MEPGGAVNRTTNKRISSLLVAVFVAASIPLGSETAEAHFFTGSPQITIHRVGNRFSGRIKTVFPICKRNRRVTLIKVRQGISDKVVAQTRSGEFGRWSLRRPRPEGSFYARIGKKVERRYLHGHRCRKARSGNTRRR